MLKYFVTEKPKAVVVCIAILLLVITEFVVCFVMVQKNKALRLEIDKLTIQVKNPNVIEKPTTIVKYVTRTITKESEPQTLILEREIEITKDGGKEVISIPSDKKANKWTAGVIYDGTIGGVVTHNVYKSLEAGVAITGKTAGVLATIRF